MNASKISGLALVALLAGCGGKSGPTEWIPSPRPPAPAPVDVIAPTAAIMHPARDVFSNAATVRVTGSAADAVGVTGVSVNGVAATTTDAFANWSVEVPISPGENTLMLEARDAAGNVFSADSARRVWQREEINNVSGGELSKDGTTLYFVDAGAHAIRALSLETGNVAHVAGLARFGAPAVLDLALDLPNDHIYVGVRDENPPDSTAGIWRYDITAESWTPISDATHPAGGAAPLLSFPSDVIFDGANNRLLVLDWTEGLFAVSLTDGARTLISNNTTPNSNAPVFGEPTDMAHDEAANRVLIVDRGIDALFAVDLSTGVRSIVSGAGVGVGTAFDLPLAMALDLPRNRALVFDTAGSTGLLAVDLASGARTVFVDNTSIQNAAEENEFGLVDVRVLAIDDDRVYGIDTQRDTAQAFDLLTAERSRISNNGFLPNAPRLCMQDADVNGSAVTAFTEEGRLVRVAADAVRTVLAGDDVPGSATVPGRVVEVDAGANVAYAAVDGSVWQVNLGSGAVALLADDATPSGQLQMGSIFDLVLDTDSNVLYVASDAGVFALDPSDGTRTRVSADNPSVPFDSPSGAALDRAGGRILVADEDYQHLIAVDLDTGEHSVFSDAGASGDVLLEPVGVAVDADGMVWAVDDHRLLVRVDGDSGARTLVSSSSLPDGANYYSRWLRPIADGDSLYVFTEDGDLFAVDKSSGARVGVARCGPFSSF